MFIYQQCFTHLLTTFHRSTIECHIYKLFIFDCTNLCCPALNCPAMCLLGRAFVYDPWWLHSSNQGVPFLLNQLTVFIPKQLINASPIYSRTADSIQKS